MPIGILGSLGVSTVLYILVAIVLTGIVSYTIAECLRSGCRGGECNG